MAVEPTFRITEFAQIVGISLHRLKFWCEEGLIRPLEGGGGHGRHRKFTKDEVRVAQLVIALNEAGISLQTLIRIAAIFRDYYLSAASPLLERGKLAAHVHPLHKRWRRRVRDALAGKPIYLLVGRPIAAEPPGDPKVAYQLDLLTPNELPKKLSGRLRRIRVVLLINLAEIWAAPP